MHCVDLDESFQTHIYLQNLASIQPRTSPLKFVGSRDNAAERVCLKPVGADCELELVNDTSGEVHHLQEINTRNVDNVFQRRFSGKSSFTSSLTYQILSERMMKIKMAS